MKQEIYCRIWTKNGSKELSFDECNNIDIAYLHRLDGPAVEWPNGSKQWWADNKLHRSDGPAVEWVDSSKLWYINGEKLDTETVETWLEENKINLKTAEGQMAFKLRWS